MSHMNQNGPCRPTRRAVLQTGAAGIALMVVGASVGKATAKELSGQVIVGFSQEPTVLHPHMPHIEVDEGVHFNLFDPLFMVGPEGAFYPALAREVPTVENGGVSADGLNWRVKLRDDVTWHDGTPFTARDVKFTLELQANPDFRALRRVGHELVRNIQIVNDHELTWEMAEPFAPYHSILSWTFMVPEHILGKAEDPNNSEFNNNPVGTGAFIFEERSPGNFVKLRGNPDYWGDGPHLETVVFRYIPDLTVLYTQFRTGDIDFIGLQGIQPDRYEQARKLEGRVVVAAPAAFIEMIGFNLGRPQFQDPEVRRALYYALDKKTIVDAIYYGAPSLTESYYPRQSYYYNGELPTVEYSLERAAEILDTAGWLPGPDGIRTKDGVRLSFKNSTTAGNNVREQAQQFMQQSLAEIGVEMEISNLPPAVMWGDYWMQSEYDTVMVGATFTMGPDPDASNFLHSGSINVQGGTGENTWQYRNPEVDALLEKGGSLFVPEERRAAYYKAQELVHDDLPFMPIFQYALLFGHKEGLEGYVPNINVRTETWHVANWKWS